MCSDEEADEERHNKHTWEQTGVWSDSLIFVLCFEPVVQIHVIEDRCREYIAEEHCQSEDKRRPCYDPQHQSAKDHWEVVIENDIDLFVERHVTLLLVSQGC